MARIPWDYVPAEVRDAVCEHTGRVLGPAVLTLKGVRRAG